MQIIKDANNNGKWDPGVLLQKIQPEKVINYNATITLKAGWDNDVDFTEAAALPVKKPAMGKTSSPVDASKAGSPPPVKQ